MQGLFMVGNLVYGLTILVPVSPRGPKMRVLDIELPSLDCFPIG